MTGLDVLIAARDRIANPDAWGKGLRNFDRQWKTCCSAEAIEEASGCFGDLKRIPAYRALCWAAGIDFDIVKWNDAPERTHSEVLATFNLAIALERNMPRDS